jgi:hypothetical protein
MTFATIWNISRKLLFLRVLQKKICGRKMTKLEDGVNKATPLYVKNTVADFVTKRNV